jgi:sugar-specific transcriptional regulator TrmB
MVFNTKLTDNLKTIGLNKYERNLWVALLARGSATAGELADISKVPRSRCYDVLESLSDKGFVVVQPGKPIRYVAMQPREALDRAKKHINEQAVESNAKIDRLMKSEALKELEKVHKTGLQTMSPEDVTGALRGRYAMLQQTETMLKKAKKYVNFITTESGLTELFDNHNALLQKMSKSGIKIKIAAPISKNVEEAARSLSKYAQIRDISETEHANKMLARLCIIDGEEFLVGLTDDVKTHPTQDIAFWTQSKHASSNIFDPMFNLVWHNSKQMK